MIDATDIHTIVHENPFCSRRHLLLRKVHALREAQGAIGDAKPQGRDASTAPLGHGTVHESRALQKVVQTLGVEVVVPDCSYQHPDYPLLSGKPDGLVKGQTACIEIKCPMRWKPISEWARFYQHQCQAYLSMLEYDRCYLCVFDAEDDTVEVCTIERDDTWWKTIRPKLELFESQVRYYTQRGTDAIARLPR